MKIFDPYGAEDYELAQPVDSADFETIKRKVNGVPRRDSWAPIRMQLIREEWDGRSFMESDAPWLSGDALIFRPHAVQAMAPLLAPHGEFLPLDCDEAELFVFNCTRVVGALDEDSSELERFSSDGTISWIRRHVFRPEVVRDVPVFKLANMRVSPTYVNEEFVTRWNEAGLRGLIFPQVWEG